MDRAHPRPIEGGNQGGQGPAAAPGTAAAEDGGERDRDQSPHKFQRFFINNDAFNFQAFFADPEGFDAGDLTEDLVNVKIRGVPKTLCLGCLPAIQHLPSQSLKSHTSAAHRKMVKCPTCGNALRTTAALTKHRRVIHGHNL